MRDYRDQSKLVRSENRQSELTRKRDDQNSEIARERMRGKICEDFWNIEEKGIFVSAFKK